MFQENNLVGRTVIVTGASGFLGSRTVAILSGLGCIVHALVRKTSKTDHLRLPNVRFFHGDVTEYESLGAAFEGADFVVHAAADTGGTEEAGRLVTIQGTKNVLECCTSYKIKKLVYISSCSVYGIADCLPGQLVDEKSPLENFPEQRGAYSWAKLEAERLVANFMAQGETSAVCLRPGTIYGPGGAIYTPMLGFSFGNSIFVVIGNGDFELPLVYIDNLIAAIIASLTNANSGGQIYNVVDSDRVNKRRYMDRLIRRLYPRSLSLYIPFTLFYSLVLIQEKIFKVLGRKPVLSCYRVTASQKPIIYDSTNIMRDLAWQSVVSFEEAVDNLIDFERKH